MGSTDEEIWPYLLCITKLQETIVKKYLKRKKWETDTFICVPEKHRDVVLDILEESKVSYCPEDQAFGYKPSHIEQLKSVDSGNKKQVVINDIVYSQVGLFDEVLKLAEAGNNVYTQNTPYRPVETRTNSYNTAADNEATQEEAAGKSDTEAVEMAVDEDFETDIDDVDDGGSTTDKYIDNTGKDGIDKVIDVSGTGEDYVCHYSDVSSVSESSVGHDECVGSNLSKVGAQTSDACEVETIKTDVKQCEDIEETMVKTGNTANTLAGTYGKRNKKSKPFRKQRKKTNQTKLICFVERREKLKCIHCGKVMASEQFYKRHMLLKHSKEALEKREALRRRKNEEKLMQVCHICHKQFADKYSLQSHVTNIHCESKVIYQCDLCGAVMKFKGSLVQHMKSVHTDERPHHCDICGKRFKIHQQLKNHKRRHDPNHIETCTICGKTVKKGQLSDHVKRHSNNRPFKCTSCDKRFFKKQDLDRHLRIHSGEKPFKCQHCSYASAIRGNLTKHLKHVKHKINMETHTSTEVQPGLSFYTIHRINTRKIHEHAFEEPSAYTVHKSLVQRYEGTGSPTSSDAEKQHENLPKELVTSSANLHIVEKIEKDDSDMVSEYGVRQHINGVEMYAYQVPGKIILSDNAHIPVSHMESKTTVSVHTVVDSSAGLPPGYSEETALYTMKPVGELSYSEDQRQYSEEQGETKESMRQYSEEQGEKKESTRQYSEGQGETRESIPQFRDNYLQYMMPHMTDIRHPYTGQ